MKLKLLFAAMTFLSAGLFAQDYEFSERLIQRFETAQRQVLQKSATKADYLSLTPILFEARKNKEKLTQQARELFRDLGERPTFTGTEQILRLGNFAFHYTIDGAENENVDPTDSNSNNIPDYIDFMASAFVDDIYTIYHSTHGYTLPPADGNAGGDALYDVYITGKDGLGFYGYVATEVEIGDNLNSPDIIELDASTSFMVMRNNYEGFPSAEDIAIKATAAHEYTHSIQYGYTTTISPWLLEGSAAWSEDIAYPGLDDNFQYLNSIFNTPDISLTLYSGDDPGYGIPEYSSWIFLRYLTDHFGNQLIKNIYERSILSLSMEAIDLELAENHNTSFDEQFKHFVITNAVIQHDLAFEPYTYLRAQDYVNYLSNGIGLKLEYIFDYNSTDIPFNSKTDGNNMLMRLSSDYFQLLTSSDFKITLTKAELENDLKFMLIKINKTTSMVEVQDANYTENKAIINVTDYQNWELFFPVVLRYDADVENTEPADYELLVSKADYLSVVENNNTTTLMVYPNPANNYLTIEMDSDNNKASIEVYSISGQLVKTWIARTDKRYDVSDLPKGVYTLKVSGNGNYSAYNKIIITH